MGGVKRNEQEKQVSMKGKTVRGIEESGDKMVNARGMLTL